MKRPDFQLLLVFLLALVLAGCGNPTVSVPNTQTPLQATEENVSFVEPSSTTASSTATPSSHPPSYTPFPTHTETIIPSPTALPGKLVLPVESLADSIPWLPVDPDHRPGVHYIGFNTLLPPFDNALVRKAFVQAVDKDTIADLAIQYKYQNVTSATNLTPPTVLGRDLYDQVGLPFDPESAKALLAEAGYHDVSAFPPVTLLVSYQGEITPGSRNNMGLALAEMWQTHLGVTVEVLTVSRPEYLDRIHNNPPDMYWIGWLADYIDPDNFLRQLFRSDAQTNYGSFSDTRFDSLVDHAQSGLDVDAAGRQVLYIEAERYLCEDAAALIPLFHIIQ